MPLKRPHFYIEGSAAFKKHKKVTWVNKRFPEKPNSFYLNRMTALKKRTELRLNKNYKRWSFNLRVKK